MGDNAVLSSPKGESGTPSPMKLKSYPEEESIIQPGTFVHNLPDPLEGTLTTEKLMARGGYSDVYRGIWTRPNAGPISVAIKRVRRAYVTPEAEDEGENHGRFERRIKREVVVWQAAKHANILEFYGWKTIDGDSMLVSPWCENGNLNQYISNHPELTDVQKLNLLHDAAQGLAHLHSLEQPIIHGDVKPENIVITNEIKGVLCDFGVSRVVTSLGIRTGLTSDGQCAGTVGFQAKELQDEHAQPTPMCDVYAFGGVILATMSGKAPFHKKLNIGRRGFAATVVAIYQDETPTPVDHPELPESDRLWRLMEACWNPKPYQRPNMRALCDSLRTEIDVRSVKKFSRQSIFEPELFLVDPKAKVNEVRGTFEFQEKGFQIVRDLTEIHEVTWIIPSNKVCTVYIKKLRYATIIEGDIHLTTGDKKRELTTIDRSPILSEKRILNQMIKWTSLKHPNILPFLGYQWELVPILIFSWYKNGNVSQYLKARADANRPKLLTQVAQGLSFLHSKSIIHGNIKPNNVIIADDGHAMLMDFGMAPDLRMVERNMIMADSGRDNVGYMSPELIEEGNYTKSSDVYAFGALILE
ncbi:hypothetical protein FRC04_007813, partial [Tulasnella sp. 424]